jgi:predicted permease
MNGHIAVIFNQITIFGILMLIGFVASRAQLIDEAGLSFLAKLIVKLILPCLIFMVVTSSNPTLSDILHSWRFFIAVVFLFTLLAITGFVMGKLFKLRDSTFFVFIALATFGNMGFIGIPLINEVYTDQLTGVSVTIYTLVDMSLLWTFGVYLCSRHQVTYSLKDSIKNMINPTTIALALGIVVLLTGIILPKVVRDTIYGIGGTSKTLSMIYLGAALNYIDHKGIYKKIHILALTFVKMILIPVLIFAIFKDFLPPIQVGILSLISGLPTMIAVVMIARAYGSDDRLATEMIFITTIACLFTIPIVSIINFYLWR